MIVNSGKLLVVTGPSGVGKGTLLRSLTARDPEKFLYSISATTRKPRVGELDGKDYYFWTRSQFEQKCQEGAFLEWAEYAGNLYGSPKQPVEAAIALGKIVILEIELVGARQVATSFPDAQKIFIAPPDLTVLEQRLRDRGQEDDIAIAKRLSHAQIELAAVAEFDLVIINDDLQLALEQLEQAVI